MTLIKHDTFVREWKGERLSLFVNNNATESEDGAQRGGEEKVHKITIDSRSRPNQQLTRVPITGFSLSPNFSSRPDFTVFPFSSLEICLFSLLNIDEFAFWLHDKDATLKSTIVNYHRESQLVNILEARIRLGEARTEFIDLTESIIHEREECVLVARRVVVERLYQVITRH
jgi:hypothetical protein